MKSVVLSLRTQGGTCLTGNGRPPRENPHLAASILAGNESSSRFGTWVDHECQFRDAQLLRHALEKDDEDAGGYGYKRAAVRLSKLWTIRREFVLLMSIFGHPDMVPEYHGEDTTGYRSREKGMRRQIEACRTPMSICRLRLRAPGSSRHQ